MPATDQPNVVLILSDQHQRDATGCYGHRLVRTPNIDRLAGRGVRFAHAYCQSPLCSPSRASLLSGTHVHTCQAWGNAAGNPMREVPTLSGVLRDRGYATGSFGKVHIIGETRDTRDLGFTERGLRYYTYEKADYIAAIGREKVDRYEPTVLGPGQPRCDAYNPDNLPVDLDEPEMFDALVVTRSIGFLEKHQRERFFLWVGLEKPHPDWYAPAEFHALYDPAAVDIPPTAREERPPGLSEIAWKTLRQAHRYADDALRRSIAAYYANVSYMDYNVGRVLKAIWRLGLDRNTIIIYTSDHGELLFSHGLTQKHCFYEPAVVVPLIICGPGLENLAGQVRRHIVSLLDLFPTVAAACGVPPPDGLEGEPLQPVLAGKAAVAGRRAFSEFYSFGFSERMVRTPRWKYIHSDGFAPQLYNEHRDPQEVTNLAGELAYAAICRELEAAVCDGWARPDPQLIARP